jgi:glycogen(starch) synthase
MAILRAGLISFEFPPSVAIGGIGTYTWEASRMLAAAGVEVEVFAAGSKGKEPARDFGVQVHRIQAHDRSTFRDAVLQTFAARHGQKLFDLIESPEIGAEASRIATAYPELAVISKLHTPSYLVGVIGQEQPTALDRLRFRLGALRRGRWAGLQQVPYNREQDPEWQFTRHADGIAAPSQAIADRLMADWDLDPERISVFPYPFLPAPDLLALPIPQQVRNFGFLGRLEARKGVVELARAIPRILRQAPQLRFRFLGPSWPYRKGDMETWIRQHCRSSLDRITFVGAVPRNQLAAELGLCDAVVLPSRWESFGLVCAEAMASGRAVIGSAAGGMAEVIQPGVSGLLVPPRSPEAIAAAVLSLVEQPEQVAQFGAAGRQRVLDHLAPERILPLQLASYERTIARARQRRLAHRDLLSS